MGAPQIIITFIMLGLEILEQIFDIHVGWLSEQLISSLLAVLWPILLLLTPGSPLLSRLRR